MSGSQATTAQASFFRDDKPPVAGWLLAAVLVALVHVILAFVLIYFRDQEQGGTETPPAIIIDLPAIDATPPAGEQTALPDAPQKTEEAHPDEMKQTQDTVPPPDVPPPVAETPPPDVPPPPVAAESLPQAVTVPEAPLASARAVILPAPPQPVEKPKPDPKLVKELQRQKELQEEREEAREKAREKAREDAKKAAKERKLAAERTAAPRGTEGAPSHQSGGRAGASGMSVSAWSAIVLARINGAKSCGGVSGSSGIVSVTVSISAGGSVVGAHGSGGDAALNAQAASIVRRAGPFPPTPSGATATVTAPIHFSC